jgi:hypothetical protein
MSDDEPTGDPPPPGPHPEDAALFAPERLPTLGAAAAELSWLLSRGYAHDAALKLVGDRHQLRDRQRMAVRRSSCSDRSLSSRKQSLLDPAAVRGRVLWVDGFNLLITAASALRGGLILRGRDGVVRDLASSHRLVLRTTSALEHARALLAALGPGEVRWLLDRPVSNSGRVARQIAEGAGGLPWSVELVNNPDLELIRSGGPVVTSDAMILDAGVPWVDLLSPLLAGPASGAWVVDFERLVDGR